MAGIAVRRRGQLALDTIARCLRHRGPLPLPGRCPQISSKRGIVRVQRCLDNELSDGGLHPGLVIQTDLFEVGDIREDAIIIGLVGGVEGGGLGGLGARHIGRGTRNRRVGVRIAWYGHRIFVGQRCR
jgi:hypothetical protein